MEPMYISIQQVETGKQIKNFMSKRGFTVKDIQHAMGFEQPQAVYKWLTGKSLPTIENLVILSKLLNTAIENILVIDGDIAVIWDIKQDTFLLTEHILLYIQSTQFFNIALHFPENIGHYVNFPFAT